MANIVYVYTTGNGSMRKTCTQFENPTISLFIIFHLFFDIFLLFLNLSPFSLMREDLILWPNWTGIYYSQSHSNPCLCFLSDGITGRRLCSIFYSVAIIKHWPKAKWEGRDYFPIQHWTQGTSLKQAPQRNCELSCCKVHSQIALSHGPELFALMT